MPVKYILGSNDKIDFTAITKLNQGAGSGVDSDLLDGLHGSAYEQVANKGVASGYASLNASSLVIQNPASKGQANGLAELDSGGKVPSSQLPALALTKVYTVSSETAQLALTAEEGDVAIRTDLNRSYARNTGTSGTMADWSELLTPTDAVLSWNGRTGAVVPQTGDYTWGQIDKTVSSLADITTKSHTLLSDIGTNTHPQIDTHIGDATIHFLQTAIDHVNLLNKGTNTHAQIDTHLGASSPHSGHEVIANKDQANGYPGLSAGLKIAGSQITYGSLVNTACEGNDSRLSDSRTPTAHKDSHKSGGGDALASTDIIEAIVKRLQESGGPTTLLMGAVADGQFLKRSGSTIIGSAGSGGASTFLDLTDTPSSYSGQALKFTRVNAGATALEFIDHDVASGVHGVSGSLVGTTDTQTLLNKLFGSTTIMKEQGIADATTTGYSSHELHFRNSMWYLGAEVKRVYKIRNDPLDPANNWYQLTILQENNTLYALKHQGSSAYIDYYALSGGEIYNTFNTVGGGGFQFNVRPASSHLTSWSPLYLYGESVEGIRLDASGVLLSGLVSLAGGYFLPSNISSLPTADSTYRGKMIRVQGGTNVADGFYICEKDTTDAYAWYRIGAGCSRVRAKQTVVQSSIPNATPTRLNLDAEDWDSNGEFTTGGNHRYTASQARKVEVYGVVRVATSAAGDLEASIYLNGSLKVNSRIAISTAGGRPTTAIVYDQIDLNAGDYIELYIWQGTGGNIDTDVSGGGSYLIARELVGV